MKANELMVGDYVQLNESVYKVEEISSQGWIHLLTVENGTRVQMTSDYILDHIEGVTITPEILEKNEFKKFDFLHIEGQYQWTWWENTLISVTLWCRELNNDTKDGMVLKIEAPNFSLCLKVNYVHELQHALSLCGIEKEIEP